MDRRMNRYDDSSLEYMLCDKLLPFKWNAPDEALSDRQGKLPLTTHATPYHFVY